MRSYATAECAEADDGGAAFACLAHYFLLAISIWASLEFGSWDLLYQLVRAIHFIFLFILYPCDE